MRRESIIAVVAIAVGTGVQGQSWNHTPADGNWNNAANWTPSGIPSGTSTVAHFGESTITNIYLSSGVHDLGGLSFRSDAPAFQFAINGYSLLNLSGAGISNSSSNAPSLVFSGGATGSFLGQSSAGNATITSSSGTAVSFLDQSSADHATIITSGDDNNQGRLYFFGQADAGNATITNNNQGYTYFGGGDAGTAKITCNAGSFVQFGWGATGGSAALVINQDAFFDMSFLDGPSLSVGSVAGAGRFNLGGYNLIVGSDNSDTAVTGEIRDGGVHGGVGGKLTKVGTGTLTLTGNNTYSGGTEIDGGTLAIASDANLGATSGHLTLDGGTLQTNADFTSDRTIVLNAGGGTINNAGHSGRFGGTITGTGALVLTGSGTVSLTGANTFTGSTSITSGATLLLSGTGSLASTAITINAGSTLADTNSGLPATATVAANGLLSLGADESIAGLSGSGSVALGSNRLSVGSGSFSGIISGTGSLLKAGSGTLTLTGANTFTGITSISQGTLFLNGSLLGGATVGAAGTLSGSGLVRGSLINQGIVAPGNSPGTLAVTGNYTESGTLRIEIVGTAGAGVAGGNDLLLVGGTATLQSGSELLLTRPAGSTFEPSRGQHFLILSAAGGIAGSFTTLDASAFSTRLIFDYGTGKIYGTGLAGGAALTELFGASSNRQAVFGAISDGALATNSTGLLSYVDSRDGTGSLLTASLKNPGVLDALSPVAYAGATDYALQVTRNLGRDTRNLPALAAADGWTLSGGYTGYRNGLSETAADDTNTDLRSNAAVVDVGRRLGERLVVGAFFAVDDGAIRARRFKSDTSGQVVGLHLRWQPPAAGRSLALESGASYGTFDFDSHRVSVLGNAASKTEADAYDLWGRAKIGVYNTSRLGLSAFAGLAYTHATVSGFTERGAADALVVSKRKDESVIGELGAEFSLQLAKSLQLVGEVAFEHDFQDPRRAVFARFADAATPFRVTACGFDENAVRGGLRVEYGLGEQAAISANYSVAVANHSEASQSFGAKVLYRF